MTSFDCNAIVINDVCLSLLLLTSSCEGDKLLIKLTDFGLAKDAQLATTIQMKSKVGSPSFMAPEVYEQKPYDAAVDVFALGLVFLGLLLRKENDEHIIPSTG